MLMSCAASTVRSSGEKQDNPGADETGRRRSAAWIRSHVVGGESGGVLTRSRYTDEAAGACGSWKRAVESADAGPRRLGQDAAAFAPGTSRIRQPTRSSRRVLPGTAAYA